jgi:hypothetical protein
VEHFSHKKYSWHVPAKYMTAANAVTNADSSDSRDHQIAALSVMDN